MFATLLISCEHAGNEIPREWRAVFKGHEELLNSHKGWDPGAFFVAEALAHAFHQSPYACHTSRLLVEANRSIEHPKLFSELTNALSPVEKKQILELYYYPHRRALEQRAAELIATASPLLHLAIHSFTPVLDGVTREVEIGLLYDPKRELEKQFVYAWKKKLAPLMPHLRIRLNVPYKGVADGVSKAMRKQFVSTHYAGIELEINQSLLENDKERKNIIEALVISLKPLVVISKNNK